ncbi:MAG: tetratricopeptide repeat protein [Catalinimonas sp.]
MKYFLLLWLLAVVAARGQTPDRTYQAAILDFNAERYEKAILGFESFLAADPVAPEARTARFFAGYAAAMTADTARAARYLRSDSLKDDFAPKGWFFLAEMYLGLGDTARALGALHEGHGYFPGYLALPVRAANVHMARREWTEAREVLAEVLRLTPDDVEALLLNASAANRLAQQHPHQGYDSLARRDYRRVLAVDPTNVMASYNLGSFYYNRAVRGLDTRAFGLSTRDTRDRYDAGQSDLRRARALLQRVPPEDSTYTDAQRALRFIEERLDD